MKGVCIVELCVSRERNRIEITDIGLKSFGLAGAGLEVLGTGVMTAVFHCRGTTPSAILTR